MVESILETLFHNAVKIFSAKVYHQVLPVKATIPAVVYSIVSRSNLKVLSGGTSLTRARVQVTCYAVDTRTVKRLARAVSRLEGARAEVSDDTTMKWIWQDDESDGYDAPKRMDNKGIRHVSVDLLVWFNEGI